MRADTSTIQTKALRKQLAKPPPSGLGRELTEAELLLTGVGVATAVAAFLERKRLKLSAAKARSVQSYAVLAERLYDSLNHDAVRTVVADRLERRPGLREAYSIGTPLDLQEILGFLVEDAKAALREHEGVKAEAPALRILVGDLAEVGVSVLQLRPKVSLASGSYAPLVCFVTAACRANGIEPPEYSTAIDYIHRSRRERQKRR